MRAWGSGWRAERFCAVRCAGGVAVAALRSRPLLERPARSGCCLADLFEVFSVERAARAQRDLPFPLQATAPAWTDRVGESNLRSLDGVGALDVLAILE